MDKIGLISKVFDSVSNIDAGRIPGSATWTGYRALILSKKTFTGSAVKT